MDKINATTTVQPFSAVGLQRPHALLILHNVLLVQCHRRKFNDETSIQMDIFNLWGAISLSIPQQKLSFQTVCQCVYRDM